MKTLLFLIAMLTAVHSTCPLGYAIYNNDGVQTCRECGPLGYYCPTESSSMQSCPENLLVTDNGYCGCGDGQYIVSNSCVPCPAGSYCTYYSMSPTPCSDDLTSVARSSACKCNGGRTSIRAPSSSSDCFCAAGSYWNLEALKCTTCSVDSYCPQRSNAPVRCPYDSTTLNLTGKPYLSDCKCIGGKYLTTFGQCVVCPIGYHCDPASNFPFPCWLNFLHTTTTSTGISSQYDCKCVAGSYLSPKSICEPCPIGYYCTGLTNTQTQCPESSQTTASAGAISINDCYSMFGPNHIFLYLTLGIVLVALTAISGLVIKFYVLPKLRIRRRRFNNNDDASLRQETV